MNTDNTSQQASNTYFQMSVYHHVVSQGWPYCVQVWLLQP